MKSRCNQKGLGLLETLIGMAVAIVAMWSFTSLLNFGAIQSRAVQSTSDFDGLVDSIKLLLAGPTGCSTLFYNSLSTPTTAYYNPTGALQPGQALNAINLSASTALVSAGQAFPTFSINSNTNCGQGNAPCGLYFGPPPQGTSPSTTAGTITTYLVMLYINGFKTSSTGAGASVSAAIPVSLSVYNASATAPNNPWQISGCGVTTAVTTINPLSQCANAVSTTFSSSAPYAATASCGGGWVAISGGIVCAGSNNSSISEYPLTFNGVPMGWYGVCEKSNSGNQMWAVCCPG